MNDEDHLLSVRLSNELYEALRRYAFDHRVAQADVVREGIKHVLSLDESTEEAKPHA